MSTASLAVLVLVGLVTVAAAAGVYRRSRATTIWVPRTARVLALGASTAIAVAVLPVAWSDSGTFALVLIGVPLGCCLVALASDVLDRWAALTTTLAAALALVWSLLTGLGLGFYFVLPAVLLAVGAATSWQTLRPGRGSPRPARRGGPVGRGC